MTLAFYYKIAAAAAAAAAPPSCLYLSNYLSAHLTPRQKNGRIIRFIVTHDKRKNRSGWLGV